MKRLVLSVAAIAALSTLTACGDANSEADAPKSTPKVSATAVPSDEPTAEVPEEPAADRFKTTFTEVSALFVSMREMKAKGKVEADATYKNAAAINASTGLDESSPVFFADWSPTKSGVGGTYCLESADSDTFTRFSFGEAKESRVTIGDGPCSYEDEDAAVIGDLTTKKWVHGGKQMGNLTVGNLFG